MIGWTLAQSPDQLVDLIGRYAKDYNTGIVGQVVGVCFSEHEIPQLKLRRYGVDVNGAPYPVHWVHKVDCAESTSAEYKGK